jgi:hypothetical protein
MTMPDEIWSGNNGVWFDWEPSFRSDTTHYLRATPERLAAKEMLAALEQTHNLLTGHVQDMWGCNANCGDRDCTCGYYKQLSINRAIIAKARGRAMSEGCPTKRDLLEEKIARDTVNHMHYERGRASRDAEVAALTALNAEMLEALELLQDGWSKNEITAGAWAKVRAALAKAKGQSHE